MKDLFSNLIKKSNKNKCKTIYGETREQVDKSLSTHFPSKRKLFVQSMKNKTLLNSYFADVKGLRGQLKDIH